MFLHFHKKEVRRHIISNSFGISPSVLFLLGGGEREKKNSEKRAKEGKENYSASERKKMWLEGYTRCWGLCLPYNRRDCLAVSQVRHFEQKAYFNLT